MYENSNYQVYLEQLTEFSNAIWEKHLNRVQDGIRREIALSGSVCVSGIEQQSWDTDVLGLAAGAISDVFHKQPLSFNEVKLFVALLEEEIQASNLRFISFRISAAEHFLLHALEGCGWRTVDMLNIYYSSINSLTALKIKSLPEPYTLGGFDLSDGLSFLKSEPSLFCLARIHSDPNISKAMADNFYKEVFCSQCSSPTNFRVGLRLNDRLVGLAIGNVDQWLADTCNVRLGYLWLIGLSESLCGKGLSKPLLAAFLAKAKDQVDHIEIGTQRENIAANRLYASAGLKLSAHTLTLHRWNQ